MCLKAGLCPLVGGVGAQGIPELVSVYWWSKLFQKIVLVQWWAELFPRVSGCRTRGLRADTGPLVGGTAS